MTTMNNEGPADPSVHEARELCKRQGLLTDKPVTGPACNLRRPWEQPA